VMAFITAADRQGLADRTQSRFFSDGTLPEDAVVDRDTTTAEVLRDARASLPYAFPRLPRLELRAIGEKRYAFAADGLGGRDATGTAGAAGTASLGGAAPTIHAAARRRLLAYQRVPGRVRFFLDDSVYADTARALLPEIGGYGAGLIDHLFRGEIRIEVAAGGQTASIAMAGARGVVRNGEIRLFAEDGSGRRRPLATVAADPNGVSVSIPPGTRRLAAALRGEDDAGELVAASEAIVVR
jgi:hypothetical protein